MRETGVVYTCPPGQHDDLGISRAMLAWPARHPHLEHWVGYVHTVGRVKPTVGGPLHNTACDNFCRLRDLYRRVRVSKGG